MIGFFIFLSLPSLLLIIDFIWYLTKKKRLLGTLLVRILEIVSMLGLPLLYIAVLDFDLKNDCCGDSATFSPEHRLSIYLLIVLCTIAYFYASYRTHIAPPILEVTVNILLLIAIILNILMLFHLNEAWLGPIGNLPVILLCMHMLIKNHQLFLDYAQTMKNNSKHGIEKIAWMILSMPLLSKVPVLLVLSLPLLVILSAILLLFGQKQDSFIRAFTDTYKHGFSQLDYMCENVTCGGHFLCSVAAKGHPELVKPQRLGVRQNAPILCNRQLLVANAFEELIQEKMPATHRLIRHGYNKVGDVVHKYYSIFNNRYVADTIYILMKPLEWLFVTVLYTFDLKPENRIAQRYLSQEHRKQLNQH
ncbi:DUF6688 domain-containing protein [Xanthocytophaga agilis]|uniref:Uncharacterized protein n=1 Tax=Xanthocytophaga agilis TaxID=3048010 RepID=A0AAE3R5L8_9BACT|nr:DUF6688 family protein [Xanthocytophaga agilis]MDJ1501889.1 hypothetical protein [Xanthocytophaga agilis]